MFTTGLNSNLVFSRPAAILLIFPITFYLEMLRADSEHPYAKYVLHCYAGSLSHHACMVLKHHIKIRTLFRSRCITFSSYESVIDFWWCATRLNQLQMEHDYFVHYVFSIFSGHICKMTSSTGGVVQLIWISLLLFHGKYAS